MKRERHEKLTAREWKEITSRRPVMRKIPAPEKKPPRPTSGGRLISTTFKPRSHRADRGEGRR